MSSAALALALTDCLEFFIAITAAMKKVLSPISETRIMPQDFKKPAARPPARRLVMLQSFELAGNLRPVLQQRQACCAVVLYVTPHDLCAIKQASKTQMMLRINGEIA